MTWVNLDDQMPEHPKIVKLSDGAFRLHISGIAYCNRHLTDGVIHAQAVPGLMPRFRRTYLAELTASSNGTNPALWLPHPDGFEIRDYLQWNRSKAEIQEHQEKITKARSEAGKRGARARWGNRDP